MTAHISVEDYMVALPEERRGLPLRGSTAPTVRCPRNRGKFTPSITEGYGSAAQRRRLSRRGGSLILRHSRGWLAGRLPAARLEWQL